MIDIIKSDDGQNNSARFFLYDKLKVNPVSVFAFFIVSMMLLSLTNSLKYLITWTVLTILISSGLKRLYLIVLKPMISFKFFLIFSFAFSYLISSDLNISLLFLFKLILLLILSRCFNYFIEFRYLLNTLDHYFSVVKPVFVRKMIRKASFSILLSVEFVSILFTDAKVIESEKARKYSAVSGIIKRNSAVLTDLFLFSFMKASEMEARYIEKENKFAEREKITAYLNVYDALIITISFLMIIFFPALK